MLLIIAWRNIWRNRGRSWVIIGAIAVGLWAGVFITAFTWGMYDQHIRDSIDNQLSHIQIHHPAYHEESKPEQTIAAGNDLVRQLNGRPGFRATGRVLSEAMLATSSGSTGLVLCGIDTTLEKKVTNVSEMLQEGTYFGDGKAIGIVLGRKVADKLKIGLKNKVIATFQDSTGEMVSAAFRVCGIFRTNNSSFDDSRAYVLNSELGKLLGTGPEIHEIAIRMDNYSAATDEAVSLKKQHPSVLVESWLQLSPELRFIIESMGQYMYIIVFVILLALTFGIVNTMLMAVLERVREFGVLMAIGLNKSRLFSMILLETILLSLVGAVVGLIIAYATVQWTGHHGINLTAFSKGFSYYGFSPVVRPVLSSDNYFKVMGLTMLAAIVASIYPALRAIQLKPAEAIRKI